MLYSNNDGVTWAGFNNYPFQVRCNCLQWNGQVFLAGGYAGTLSYAYTPVPSNPWYSVSSTAFTGNSQCTALNWNGSYWLAGGVNAATGYGILQRATNFNGFTTVTGLTLDYSYSSIIWNGRMWLIGASGANGTTGMKYSYDVNGATWTNITIAQPRTIMWDGNMWYAVGGTANANNIIRSVNGINWEIVYTGFSSYCSGIAHNKLRRPNRLFIADGTDTASVTVVGGTLTTSDVEFVDNGEYHQGGYDNFSVRIN